MFLESISVKRKLTRETSQTSRSFEREQRFGVAVSTLPGPPLTGPGVSQTSRPSISRSQSFAVFAKRRD